MEIRNESGIVPVKGTLCVWNGAGWEYLLPGSAGQVLTSDIANECNTLGLTWTAGGGGGDTPGGYTITLASGGHQNVAATCTITMSAAITGTFTATPSGGISQCGLYSPYVVTFSGTTVGSFTFTPLIADTVTFLFTNSVGATGPASQSYTATGQYFLDNFTGTGLIQGHTSNSVPGVVGSLWGAPSQPAITLDGSGNLYLSTSTSSGTTINTSNAAIAVNPAAMPSVSANFEVIFSFTNSSTSGMGANWAGVVIFWGGGSSLMWGLHGNNYLSYLINGAYSGSAINLGQSAPPAPGVTWMIKLDITNHGGGYISLQTSYSTNLVSPYTWQPLSTGVAYPWYMLYSEIGSAVPAAGVFFANAAGQNYAKIGNLTYLDQTPPSPNCVIPATITTPAKTVMPGAYVTTCGSLIAVFFNTQADNTPVFPTQLNYAPGIYQNGTLIGAASVSLVTGYHLCALLQVPGGIILAPSDTVQLSAPASWMTCGAGNAAAALSLAPVSTASIGGSQANIGTLTKTFKPGFNFDDLGSWDECWYNIPRNWRLRLQAPVGSTNLSDGYPSSPSYTDIYAMFYDQSGANNGVDATRIPGFIGYWCIAWDDLNFATAPTTIQLTNQSVAGSIITPIPGNTMPGVNGMGQQLLYNVQPDPAASVATISLGLQFTNASKNLMTGGGAPSISNLVIYGPGDFTVPPANNTNWPVPRPTAANNPYQLSQMFRDRFHNSCGSVRWGSAYLSFASQSNASERWEMRNNGFYGDGGLHGGDGLDWSWNNRYWVTPIQFTAFRELLYATGGEYQSPYVYLPGGSADGAFPGTSYPLTLGTALAGGVTAGTMVTGITLNNPNQGTDAYAIPIYGQLLYMASGGEKCRIAAVSGTANPFTVTLERGSSGTTPTAQASSSTVNCYGRLAITSLSQLGGQLFEVVTAGNHNLKTGQILQFTGNGPYPNLFFTDGSTWATLGGANAAATAVLTGNVVTSATVTAGGSGYPTTGGVRIPVDFQGGGGSGASGYATSNASGVVTSLTVSTGGSGYTSPPNLVINHGTIANYSTALMVTGPNTFVADMGGATGGAAATLGPSTSQPGTPTNITGVTNCNFILNLPDIGFAIDFVVAANAQLPGCNLDFAVPMMASDSWCYWAANIVKTLHPPGRTVYLELGNEPWNYFLFPYKTAVLLSSLNGWATDNIHAIYQWQVTRTNQVRNIFRSVFGSRASEIKAGINIQYVIPGNTQSVLAMAVTLGAVIDVIYVAPYVYGDASTASITWAGQVTIQQELDTFLHNVYYCGSPTVQGPPPANNDTYIGTQHLAYIAAYNSANSQNCILVGYEGGATSAYPVNCTPAVPNSLNLNHDVFLDPNMLFVDQDLYAYFQAFYVDLHQSNYDSYYDGVSNYCYYHGPAQQHGYGTGVASPWPGGGTKNNRLYRSCPGLSGPLDYTKSSTGSGWNQNQEANTDSVRGEALLAWMKPATVTVTTTVPDTPGAIMLGGL